MPINPYCVSGRRGNTQSVQVLFCPTPEEGMSIFSKEATAAALATSSEQWSDFAKGGDPSAWFVEVLVLTVFVAYPVYGKSYSLSCASNKFCSLWLGKEGVWRLKNCPNSLLQTTMETWAGTEMFIPKFKLRADACWIPRSLGQHLLHLPVCSPRIKVYFSRPAQSPFSDAVMCFHLWNASIWAMNVSIFGVECAWEYQDVPQLNYHLASVYLSCLDT